MYDGGSGCLLAFEFNNVRIAARAECKEPSNEGVLCTVYIQECLPYTKQQDSIRMYYSYFID